MDISKYFLDYMLVIFLISIHRGFCSFEDDYEDLPAIGRCPRIKSKLKNGRVRLRYKGRVAKFLCDSGYELAGKRTSTCVRGQWSNPTPVCVARGCNRVPSISNGRVTEMYRGALLMYDCNPGYTLSGDASIHCDGLQWNAPPPICTVNPNVVPETSCDFESPFLCGWSHDPTHDFDWRRNQFATPSGHVGTGPSFDHTFGKDKAGYYMFIEASSPRKINDTARLFSPVYPAHESGGCFTFWYHMYGATTGGLRVYFKPESHVFGELSPKWEKFGDQGNQWLRGNISIPFVTENFQIVIEGIRGESYVGDSAIDDVQLSPSDCQAIDSGNYTTSEAISANSCRGRCRTENPSTEESCDCKPSCVAAGSCCSDYYVLCSDSNEPFEQNTNEPEPGDYYGKTASPLTVTATSSPASTTEIQSSSASLNISSQSTTQSSMSSSASYVPVATSTVRVAHEASPSWSWTSSPYPSTGSTKVSSILNVSSGPQTATDLRTINTSTAPPITEMFSPKSSTISTTATSSTTYKSVTSAFPSTKTTFMTSSRSIFKTSSATPKTTQSTTLMTIPSTTTTSTTQRSSTTTTSTTQRPSTTTTSTTQRPSTTTTRTTQRPSTTTTSITQRPSTTTTTTTQMPSTTTTTTTQRPSTTAPLSTTQSSTTTTPVSTTRSSTTFTQMSTTQSSTRALISTTQSSSTTTPLSTTITSPSTSVPSTTISSTTLKPIPTTFTQSTSISTLVSAAAATSSVTQSSPVTNTVTPRYSLRPRYRTSAFTWTTYSSTISSRTTATESSRSSTVFNRPTPSRRWFDLKDSSTSVATRTIISTTKVPFMRPTHVEYVTRTSKYPYQSKSPFSTTTDSYDMVASKTQSSKSSGSSSVVICVVVFAVLCIVGGSVFYIRRYRRKRLSKFDDNSELRFLPENDYMDYSDSSALERILAK